MSATKNDVIRLLQFSLNKIRFEYAVREFPMFKSHQIKAIYSLRPSARKRLLEQRVNTTSTRRQCRNPEQAQKMADIATDPSNR